MKKIIIIALLLFVGASNILAQNVGVEFFNGTFEEALQQAKKENKLLIIDCYTSWCGPCKDISANVLPLKEAGDFFNPKFVFLKIDMEKGEGPSLAKKFVVRSYPTFILFNNDGTERHRIIGGGKIDRLIERITKGVNFNTSEIGLTQRYKEGSRDAKFMFEYLTLLDEVKKKDVVEKYYTELMSSLNDQQKQSSEYFDFYNFKNYTDFGTDNFEYLIRNRKEFIKNSGKDNYYQLIEKIIEQEAFSQIRNNCHNDLSRADKIKNYDNLISKTAQTKIKSTTIKLLSSLVKASLLGNKEDYKVAVFKIFDQLPSDELFLRYTTFTQNMSAGDITILKIIIELGDEIKGKITDNAQIEAIQKSIDFNKKLIVIITNALEKHNKQ